MIELCPLSLQYFCSYHPTFYFSLTLKLANTLFNNLGLFILINIFKNTFLSLHFPLLPAYHI